MKNTLKKLGITIHELANLLLVPEQTLHTWFNRKTIPFPHNELVNPIEIYALKEKQEEIALLRSHWDEENHALLKEKQAKALKELKFKLKQAHLKLEKHTLKEQRLLSRWHLAENYPQYLKPELQNTQNVQEWCNLLGRKSKFELFDVRLAILKAEQQCEGLKAEIEYLESLD